MIGRLRGVLLFKRPPALMIDVGGVAYELEAPMSTFYALPDAGTEVMVYTHLQIREDAHHLFGFSSEEDRQLFRTLLKVNGVGARVALAILSGMDAMTFGACIRSGDSSRLTRIPGIGKKTAERLIIELRDRLGAFANAQTTALPTTSAATTASRSAEDEAIDALIALGYKPQEASRMINAVNQGEMSAEALIRQALKAAVK